MLGHLSTTHVDQACRHPQTLHAAVNYRGKTTLVVRCSKNCISNYCTNRESTIVLLQSYARAFKHRNSILNKQCLPLVTGLQAVARPLVRRILNRFNICLQPARTFHLLHATAMDNAL